MLIARLDRHRLILPSQWITWVKLTHDNLEPEYVTIEVSGDALIIRPFIKNDNHKKTESEPTYTA